ncbi:FRG domain-containing protein [Rhizobium leguminosarum]
MFTTERPAESVHELLEWLRDQHQPGFLYRGQVNDYPVLVPSFFRPLVVNLADPAPIVEIDSERFSAALKQSVRNQIRNDMLSTLIRTCGLGLGNIIAQQYGLTSETIDVTEDLDVAAFFATRRYPGYYHVDEGGVGVIYRFRNIPKPTPPQLSVLSFLDDYFQRGKSDAGFFDFFVKHSEMEQVFGRDRWWESQPGMIDTVATLPFSLSWSDLKAAIAAERDRFRVPISNPYDFLSKNLAEVDWRLTRFATQNGGFVRPTFFWEARVPNHFVVARDGPEAARARGGMRDFKHLDEPFWPLVIPSAAIKTKLTAIENMRSHPKCEAYFFSRSEKRKFAGPYRRDLWPEPADDPLYATLWNLAISKSFRHYPDDPPAIDDPEHGVLDRGYRVANEKHTRDAREHDDLMRGQLEDAVDGIASGKDLENHFSRHAAALFYLDRYDEAFRSIMAGLRINRENVDLLIALGEALRDRGKWRWSELAVERAFRAEPNNPATLEAMAVKKMDSGDFGAATNLIEQALRLSTDDPEHIRRKGYLTALRAVVANLQHEEPLYSQLLQQVSNPNWIGPDAAWVTGFADRLKQQLGITIQM